MKFRFVAILSIAALAALGKPASTHWETKPKTHKHGVAFRCPFCGQTWGKNPPNLKAWEIRHLNTTRSKGIKLHMKLIHHKNG